MHSKIWNALSASRFRSPTTTAAPRQHVWRLGSLRASPGAHRHYDTPRRRPTRPLPVNGRSCVLAILRGTVNSRCGPSGIGCPTGCAPRCSCGCCPATSVGTLNKSSRRSCFHDHHEPAAGRPTPQSRSLRPSVPTPRWPRPPVNAPPTITPAQLLQPARRPGHHLRQPCSARPRHASVHHDHHAHPASAVGLRTTRRLPMSRPGVVSTPTPPDHSSTPNPSPNRELRANRRPDAWWKDPNPTIIGTHRKRN